MGSRWWLVAGAIVPVFAAMLSGPALAQPKGSDIIEAHDVEGILAIAAGRGEALREDQANGNPGIFGDIGGIDYYLYFVNCDEGPEACEDLNFYAAFADVKPGLEKVNEWNRDRRFGKAYLDQDEDAVIELDLNLEYGVTRDNLDAGFQLWGLILEEFTDFIGYEP